MGSQHLPEGAAPQQPQGDRHTSPAMDMCANAQGEGGVWVNPGGVGTADAADEVHQHKVVSGRHSETRKPRPVRSGTCGGYAEAGPITLQD